MNDEEIIINEIIKVFKTEKDVVDMMEEVNAKKLGISEIQFSEAMYKLQNEGKISGAIFTDDNPHEVVLWDDIKVHTENFRTIEHD